MPIRSLWHCLTWSDVVMSYDSIFEAVNDLIQKQQETDRKIQQIIKRLNATGELQELLRQAKTGADDRRDD